MKSWQILIIIIIVAAIGGSIYYYSSLTQSKKKIVVSISYNDGGSVTPSSNQIVNENDNLEINITPNNDYHIKNVLIDDISKGTIINYSFTNIVSNHTLNVIFEKDPPIIKKKIVVSITYNDGGDVTPSNNQIVKENDNLEINITPHNDYHIKNVLIDDISKGTIINYSFTNIVSNHTLNVIFEKNTQKVEITKLWDLPTQITDVALSTTGDYIVAISKHTLQYYSKNSNTQLWSTSNIQEAMFATVSMSNDGNYVIASDDTGRIYYYSNTLSRTGNSPAYSWTSVQIKGILTKDIIKLSDDGNSLFVIDSGNTLYYFKDCNTKTGQNVEPYWTLNLANYETTSIAISSDAKYASIGGSIKINNLLYPYVSYIDISNGKELWNWQSTFEGSLSNIVISNDGQKVITAINNKDSSFSGIYYWKQATQLNGNNIQYNWYSGEKDTNNLYVSASQNIDLASLEDSIKGTIMIWENLDTLPPSQTPMVKLGPGITASTIANDATMILTLMKSTLKIYDPQGNNLATQEMPISYDKITLAKSSELGALWGENGLNIFIIKIT